MLLKLGAGFEIEISVSGRYVYIRAGAFERYYNGQGLPNGTWRPESY